MNLVRNILSITIGIISVCSAGSVAAYSYSDNPLANVDRTTYENLRQQAPRLDPKALEYALKAARCAANSGDVNSPLLSIIDFSKRSDSRRLWVLDVERETVVYNEWVAHGVNSGNAIASQFSNKAESRKTSIGVFRTAETYKGKHGYSLKLDGLDGRFNGNARKRAIVIHGADYVDVESARKTGRVGRSWGCPALRKSVSEGVINTIKQGSLLVAYYPDRDWFYDSAFLNCPVADLPEPGQYNRSPKLMVVQGDTKPPRLHMLSPVDGSSRAPSQLAFSKPLYDIGTYVVATAKKAATTLSLASFKPAKNNEADILHPVPREGSSIADDGAENDIVLAMTDEPEILTPVTLATEPLPIAVPVVKRRQRQRGDDPRKRFTNNRDAGVVSFSFLQ